MAMSSPGFAGRSEQLALLDRDLEEVSGTGHGRFVLVRGRRQVGKSRLVEEFIERAKTPSVFFTATKGRDSDFELAEFADLMASTDSDGTLRNVNFRTWDASLGALARSVKGPTVVVVDEFPYLLSGAPDVEGAFQKAWDRSLKRAPILLIVVGSDLAMMDALTEYGRPLYGRPTREIHLGPLNPAETATLIGLEPVDALDAYLVTGGFPNLVNRWRHGQSLRHFLREQFTTSTEPLTVSGERMVTAEFPSDSHARAVLSAIGSGVPTFTAIATHTGLAATSLDRALKLLVSKRAVAIEYPTSAAAKTSETRYRIADTYLAFWFRFVERSIPHLDRGRGKHVLDEIIRQWPDYRGRAIEPVVRESIARLVPFDDVDADTIGSYWTRDRQVEVDIVGVSGASSRRHVGFIGSIKWHQRSPFSGGDASALAAQRSFVPGADERTILIAVSSSGFDVRDIPVQLGPGAILGAWK